MAHVERTRRAARTLHSDVVAREVGEVFADAGIPFLLLRGPVLERLRRGRTYADVDLLVPSSRLEEAADTLRRLGFAPLTTAADFRLRKNPHAHEWRRADGGAVDLHHTLSGAEADGDVVWSALAESGERVSVGGTPLPTPGRAGTALVAALHAAHHGPRARKTLLDLEAALAGLAPDDWRAAADLAKAVRAEGAFGTGLRLTERGAELARSLALADDAPADVRLRASAAPPVALSVLALLETPGLRAKARLVVLALFPTPAGLRHARPFARRGRAGLALAYATHPLWGLHSLVLSAGAVRRARRGLS